jgi:hypothetical protein
MGSGLVKERLANAKSVDKAATVYSVSVRSRLSKGYSAVLISSTAGSIAVSLQTSLDNVNFYDAVDTDGTAIGGVCSALTVTTGTYIQFPSVVSDYVRFKIIEGNAAATVVTIDLLFVESV